MIHVVGDRGQLGKSILATGKAIPAGGIKSGDIVINCAAATNHNICQHNADRAWHSNIDLVRQLVDTCKRSDAFLIHISTDYVFNKEWAGNHSEDKQPRPIPKNVYAMTKWIAEEYLRICNFDNWVCIRTSWLFSPYRTSEWLSFPTVWDQYGSPVWTPNFADALINFCEKIHVVNKKDFYHFTTNTITSRLELAAHYKEKPVLTVRCPADRPHCSALLNTKIEWEPKPFTPMEVIDAYRKVHPWRGIV